MARLTQEPQDLLRLEAYISGSLPWPREELLDMSDGFYTPEDDITETLADGRTVLIAAKGVPVPMHGALARGLVKAPVMQQPSETKTDTSDTHAGVTELQPRTLAPGEQLVDAAPGLGIAIEPPKPGDSNEPTPLDALVEGPAPTSDAVAPISSGSVTTRKAK